jgi:alkylation response protein AidB-like acyl-CoA dehydrogenase
VNVADDVRSWLAEAWRPDLTVREWWRLLTDVGFAHPTWPEGVGGRGMDQPDAQRILAALAEHRVVAPATGHLAATLAAPTVLEHGTEAQIVDLVRPIALGERAWCQLFSEPGAGSDLAALTTGAERDGDDWVVTGQKVWSSSAHLADTGMLLARTNPSAPKHHGLTWFAIDMHQPGVQVRPLKVMNGTTPFCEVFLTEARVSDTNRVGGIDEGWRVARTTMRHERTMVAGGGFTGFAQARSGPEGDLDRSVGEVVERSSFDGAKPRSPIRAGAVPARLMVDLAREAGCSGDAVDRQELARYHAQVRVNGWTMRRSGAARGSLTGADGSIAKLTTASICQQSRDLTYRLVGANLLLQGPDSPLGGDLQAVNLASPGNRIGGGTDEIQRNVLGENALDLPREHQER